MTLFVRPMTRRGEKGEEEEEARGKFGEQKRKEIEIAFLAHTTISKGML